MTARSPAFLHRSFEHELLLQPCGFTNIAVVLVPEKSDVRSKSPNETHKRRWLLFVDQRRGLLGRTVLECPTRAESPPRRRRSYQSYTRSTPTASVASVPEINLKLPAKSADLLHIEARQDDDRRPGRRSLPLLIERSVGSAGVTACRSIPAAEGNHDHVGERGEDSPTEGDAETSLSGLSEQREDADNDGRRSLPGAQLADNPSRLFAEASSPLTSQVEQLQNTTSGFSVHGAPAAASSVPEAQPMDDSNSEDKHDEEGGAVKILLRGLNRPFLVAAAAGGSKGIGVFFVDHATTPENNVTTTTAVAAMQSQVRVLDKTKPAEPLKGTRASQSSNRPDADRTGRLCLLRWGAEQPITLINDLCNPVALCVSGSDSSVFVLEQALGRRQHKDDDDRDRGSPRQHPGRRRKDRYQVCRLDGAQLFAWLSNRPTRSSVVSCSEFATPHKQNGQQAGDGSIKLNSEGECEPTGGSASDNTNFLEDESETEWEASSSSSDGGDFGRCRTQDTSSLPGGARAKEIDSGFVTRSRRRRGVVSFVRVLELPPASSRTNDQDSHPEQPVDMCVAADGTIVVAFSRSAPLHGGVSIAEKQGVVRAFPAADSGTRKIRLGSGVGTALSSTNTADQAFVRTPISAAEVSRVADGYDVDDSWLVTEGLPVVTGLAAGGGDAVYMSLCGARHDGAVTAVGALSTRQRRQFPLRTDDPREHLRGRAENWKGGREPPAGRESMLARGSSGSGSVHRVGGSFVRIASGFAAALAVDDDMNLFYITAESRGSCCALWCNVPGAGYRKAASLGQNYLSVRVTAAGTPSTTIAAAAVPVAAMEQAGTVPERETGDGDPVDSLAQLNNKKGCSKAEARHAHRMKAQAAATAAAKRAAALSAALLEDDDQATYASRAGKKPLFASSHDSPGGLRADAIGAGFGGGHEHASVDMRDDEEGEKPVNIAVVSRCRPLLVRETRRGVRAAVSCDGNEIVVSGELLPNKRPKRFGFDRVFGPGTSQARVYAEAVYPVVRKVLDGFNCSVLAYGQTGSGKTFTMEGGLIDLSSPGQDATAAAAATADPKDCGDATAVLEIEKIGVIPRAVHTIFREGGSGGSRRYWVYVSHMEIYNERLFDLLAPSETAEVAANDPAAVSSPPRSPSRRSRRSRRSPSHRSPRIAAGDGSLSPQRIGRSPRAEGSKSTTRKLSPRHGQRKLSPRQAGGGGGSGGDGGVGAGLTIEEDRHLGVVVKALTQVEVKSPDDIFAIIARSKSNRRTAETMCNVESSRSHGVFCVRVISAEPTPWGGEVTRDGRLSLVDLSGSENIKRSGAVGARAKEAAAIGQSLLALGRVIKALVKHAPHIPYRESKLTRVLGDSLGGNAFTAIILNITPNSGMLDETLNTLTYAKMAQSVQNTPKQRIANKAPSDEATTGGGGADNATSSPDAPNLSCNIAKELKRWQDGARSRALSSGLSQSAHIRPWEGKIPIHAPPQQASPRPFSGPHNDHAGGEGLVPLPQRRNTAKAPIGDDRSRRRPATAGVTRTRSMAPAAGGSTGSREVLRTTTTTTTRRRGGGGEAALTSAELARAGLLSSSSENGLLSTCPRDRRRDERVAAWRVFDSTAAEWVHTAVLKHEARRTPAVTTGARFVVAGGTSLAAVVAAAAAGQGEGDDGASLTTAAKIAIDEVFDRYDRSSKAGRGFLLASEIAALQEIWTRPDAEPPPPLLFKPKSARQETTQVLVATDAYRARSAAVGGGRAPSEVPGARNNDGPFDKRVLTRPAFVEFCRRAAARDAIFICHFFTRSGYDYRLELTVPPIAATMEPYASSGRRRRGSAVSERRNSTANSHNTSGGNDPATSGGGASRPGSRGQARPRRGGSLGGGGGKSGGKGVETTISPAVASSQDRGPFVHENDELLCLASGGLVDPAELWLWTEDERDHGERKNRDGLLSRGGGAHVSRMATTATLGAFASTKASCSAATTTPDKENAGGTSTAEVCGTEAGKEANVGCLPESNPAGDAEITTADAAPKSGVYASTSLCGVAPLGGGLACGVGDSTVSSRGPSAQCEWCGAVVVAGRKASHSAAFCDEELYACHRQDR